MHKRTVSNQLHSHAFHAQNYHFNPLKASTFIPSNCQTNAFYGQTTFEFAHRKKMDEKYELKDRCKTQFQDSWASSNHNSSFNIERLKQLEEMKSSNIDDLNYKIKSLINKLAVQSSMHSSNIFEVESKVRLKTQNSSNFGQRLVSFNPGNQTSKLGSYESKKMLQSKIFSQKNEVATVGEGDRFKNRKQNEQVAMIRLKYKNSKNDLTLKNSFSFANNCQAQKKQRVFVQPKQKCKLKIKNYPDNTKKDKHMVSQKQNVVTPSPLKSKKNINQEFSNYEKKLQIYNRKRTQLLKQCKNSFVLQDLSSNSNCNTSSVYSSTLFTKKQLNYSPKQFKIYEEGENQLPTADFRKIDDKDVLHTFLSSLLGQIKLDQEFRNAKKWFSRYSEIRKWATIEQQISHRRIDLDEVSVKQIFTLREEEQADFTVKTVVDAFLESEQHWFLNIVKKFDRNRLEESGFTEKAVDISGKGYVSIEDFVRVINMEMSTQVRNRDLFLIFQRLNSEQKLMFGDLMEVVCR